MENAGKVQLCRRVSKLKGQKKSKATEELVENMHFSSKKGRELNFRKKIRTERKVRSHVAFQQCHLARNWHNPMWRRGKEEERKGEKEEGKIKERREGRRKGRCRGRFDV